LDRVSVRVVEVNTQKGPLSLHVGRDALDGRHVEWNESALRVGHEDSVTLHVNVDLAWNDVLRVVA